MKKLKVAFFGTPDFSVPSLDMLHNHPLVELDHVISMPDRKAGRGYQLKSPEVIEFARNNKVSFFQTENINKEKEFLNKLKDCDLFIVLAFAQFLNEEVLALPKIGCFNIHTSLLPKYRGAAPIQYAILNGDSKTGVSIQRMVKKMDAGDIVHSHEINISPEETGGSLYTKLKFQAALSLSEFLWKLDSKDVEYAKQDESKVSFAPTLSREMGKLIFETSSFKEVKNKIRALFPWPGTYCQLNDKRLKVFNIEKSHLKLNPGVTDSSLGELHVGLQDISIRLTEIQLEGKKRSSDRELLNGIKSDIKLS